MSSRGKITEGQKMEAGKKPGAVRNIMIVTLVLVALFFVSFALGRYNAPVLDAAGVIVSKVLSKISFGLIQTPVWWTSKTESVVWLIRLPRIVLACLVGGALSVAGASYQGVFQNPMAAPDILGASNGAAFGAALAILMSASSRMTTTSAFIFSLLTVSIVYTISRVAPGMKVMNLILAGVMISSLFSAGTSYIKLVADPTDKLSAITYWMMGSLSGTEIDELLFVVISMLIGLVPLFLIRWQINLLTLGDQEAHALGVNTNMVRLIVIICATLITAASVSVSGLIGWVGLAVPHFSRKLVGNDYKYLLPASWVSGAVFLLLVDNVSRNLLATEIPIGILIAFVGAPFFVYLLFRKQ